VEAPEKVSRSKAAINGESSVRRPNTEGMKRPTDHPIAIPRLSLRPSGALPFHGVLAVILATVPQSDAETRDSRETQPSNRTRQMVNVAGYVIPILAALGKKRKN
jgi:hypothetical protein